MPHRKFRCNDHGRATLGSGPCYGEERLSTETVLGSRTVIVNPADAENSCWLYNGKADEYGTCNGKSVHRFAYSTLVGKIPAGHVVHHICENPGCINPRHLDASMTNAEHLAHHAALRKAA